MIGAVVSGQVAARRLMVDTCRLERPGTGEQAITDWSTLDTPDPAPTELYAGPCRVKPNGGDRVVMAGDDPTTLLPFAVSVPPTVTDVRVDDVVVVLTSGDPALVGRRLRIRSVAVGTHLTARRLGCEEAEA